MENELAVVSEVKFDLALARAPKQVLAEAQEAAKALQTVISGKKNAVKFNGKHYLDFQDWQTCGRFYGVTAKVVSTEIVDIGGAVGFMARAEAISTQSGAVLSAADAMCLNDEPNWQKKPLFQLRSMAQTRACAKALRNVLAWVGVLAGYEATPAEEITGEEHHKSEPIPGPEAAKPAPSGDTVNLVPVRVSSKATKTGGMSYSVQLPDGGWASSFDENVGALLSEAKAGNKTVALTLVQKGEYKNISKAELVA